MFSTRVLLVVTGEKEKSAPTSRKFEYLKKLDEYHHNWLDNSDMPVLKVSTEENVFKHENVEKVKNFINKLIEK